MTQNNQYNLSFDDCKRIPFAEIFAWLGIRCERGMIYEDGKPTNGWKLNEQENVVNDFTAKSRPKGDPVSFVRDFMKLAGNNEARAEIAQRFGTRFGTMVKTPPPAEKKEYVDVSGKWEQLPQLSAEEMRYLSSRAIQYERVKDLVRSNNGIAVPLRDEKGKIINIKVRSIDPNAKQRFWQEKGASPYGLYMGEIDESLKFLIVTEGMFDFLTSYQTFKNTVGLNNWKNGIEILKHYQKKGFKVVYIYDNDEAGKESKTEMQKLFGKDILFINISKFGNFKDLNELWVKKNSAIDLIDLIKYPQKYIDAFEVDRLLHQKETGEDPINTVDDRPYTWGTDELNKTITPIQKNHFIVLSGETGSGKTAWVFDVARKNAQSGHKVAFISLEMTTEAIKTRDAREYAGITKEQWRDKTLISEDQKTAYEKRKAFLSGLPGLNLIGFPKQEKITIKIIEKIIRHAKFDLIIIDNLDCIQKEKDSTREYDHEKQIADMCMNVTNEVNKPVLLIHHLRKNNEKGKGPRGLDSFKGSSKITHNADGVLLVYRPPFEKAKTNEDKAQLFIYQLKDRDFGIGGKCVVYFNRGTFEDIFRDKDASDAQRAVQGVFFPPEEDLDAINKEQNNLFNN